jgi:hypothetical protein
MKLSIFKRSAYAFATLCAFSTLIAPLSYAAASLEEHKFLDLVEQELILKPRAEVNSMEATIMRTTTSTLTGLLGFVATDALLTPLGSTIALNNTKLLLSTTSGLSAACLAHIAIKLYQQFKFDEKACIQFLEMYGERLAFLPNPHDPHDSQAWEEWQATLKLFKQKANEFFPWNTLRDCNSDGDCHLEPFWGPYMAGLKYEVYKHFPERYARELSICNRVSSLILCDPKAYMALLLELDYFPTIKIFKP